MKTFYDYYFTRYQQQLVWFANTLRGREFLQIRDKEPIWKLVPNGHHIILDKQTAQARFYTRNLYGKWLLPYLVAYDVLCSTGKVIGWQEAQDAFLFSLTHPYLLTASQTINDTSADGIISNDNQGTYANCRGLASGTASSPSSGNVYASKLTSFSIGRAFFPFNSSSLGAGSIVTATSLQFQCSVLVAGSPVFHAMKGNQASTGSLVGTDYARPLGLPGQVIVSGGNVTGSVATLSISLNASGLQWISNTGFSLLGLCEKGDQQNSDPGNVDNRATITLHAAAVNIPQIIVTYTPPPLISVTNTGYRFIDEVVAY